MDRAELQPAALRAGVNHGFSPNDLRHTAAAWTIALGGSVYDVQKMLRHSKASITLDTYGELFDKQQTDLVRRQDEALTALTASAPVGALTGEVTR